MVNSSTGVGEGAGVGKGVGVCALNQPARERTATTTRRELLFNMPQEYAQEKWNQ